MIIHADEVASEECVGGYGGDEGVGGFSEEKRWAKKARIEVFTVGQDVGKGEKLQW